MIYKIVNDYSVVLAEVEAESEGEALDKYAREEGYDSFDDMPKRDSEKLKVSVKSSEE